MRKMLANLAAGRRLGYGFAPGRSTSGGLSGTLLGLRRRGLLDAHNQLTEEGRKAAAQ